MTGMTGFQKLYCFLDYNKGKIGVFLVLAGLALFVLSTGTVLITALPLLASFSPAPMIGVGVVGAGGISMILSGIYSNPAPEDNMRITGNGWRYVGNTNNTNDNLVSGGVPENSTPVTVDGDDYEDD